MSIKEESKNKDEINWCKECNGTGGDSRRGCLNCYGKGYLTK